MEEKPRRNSRVISEIAAHIIPLQVSEAGSDDVPKGLKERDSAVNISVSVPRWKFWIA